MMTVKFQKMIPAIFLKSKTRLVEAGEHRIYIYSGEIISDAKSISMVSG